jgi:hypothetical protein
MTQAKGKGCQPSQRPCFNVPTGLNRPRFNAHGVPKKED